MIKLEPFTQNDFTRLISWIDSEELLFQFAGLIFKFPLTSEQLENYLKDKNRQAFKVIEQENDTTIGHAEIYFTDKSNAKLCRILIGDSEFLEKRLCNKITNKLLDIAFSTAGINSVELNVFEWNLSAIKCYKSVGFKTEKRKSNITEVNGKFWKLKNMKISKEEWNKFNPIYALEKH